MGGLPAIASALLGEPAAALSRLAVEVPVGCRALSCSDGRPQRG